MNVLMQNRPEQLWQGGDMVQLRQTAAALGRLGVSVEYSGEPIYPIPLLFRGFDIVHNFNFSMAWSPYQAWTAVKHKRPLVYSMIYHEGDQFVPYYKQQIIADNTDAMIFLTEGEIERVERHIEIDRKKCHVIPNGVDPFWFRPVRQDEKIPQYVLTVGRVEPSKGQLAVARACKKLGVHYVMIGQRTDEEYTKMCEAEDAAHFPPMGPDKLIKFYGQCSVFVLASDAEVQPLSVMEAMAQGAQVILTDKCEWRVQNVLRCHPGDSDDIEAKLRVALVRMKNTAGIQEMKGYSWDDCARSLLRVYQSIT